MLNTSARVSVVMTCHNEARWLEQAVLSVVEQTSSAAICEVLVVDDGSTDESPKLLADLSERFRHVCVLRTDGVGPAAARNIAIRMAQGDVVAFLDSDDFWHPRKLEAQLPVLDRYPGVGVVYTDFVDVPTEGSVSGGEWIHVRRYAWNTEGTLQRYYIEDGPLITSTLLVRRAVFDDVGVFDEGMRIGEDTDLLLRIAHRWQFQHVAGALVHKRRHARSLTSAPAACLPAGLELTGRFAARWPELAPLAGRRRARRYMRAAADYSRAGLRALALKHLATAIRHAPLFWRPYAYMPLVLLPLDVRRGLLSAMRQLSLQRKHG